MTDEMIAECLKLTMPRTKCTGGYVAFARKVLAGNDLDRYEAEHTRGQETDRDWPEAQDWKDMDGATAFLLINRHADGWGDTRAMMEAWLAANGGALSSGG